jgi:hypothetical protein
VGPSRAEGNSARPSKVEKKRRARSKNKGESGAKKIKMKGMQRCDAVTQQNVFGGKLKYFRHIMNFYCV